MAHPYLEEERKRRPGDMDIPVDDPYPDQQAMALAPTPAPSLAPAKAPAPPQALASSLTPTKDMPDPYEEKPLQAEAGPSRWVKALNALPAIASGAMHLSGYGNEQTRQQGYKMASDAAAQNMELDRRAANSRARAAMYNNKLQQRRQALARQKEQDTIAAEDRGRRIKAEDLQIQLEAEKRDPTSPKNMAFKKSLADAYPVVWNSLTPEEQENMTVERGQALQLQLQDEARKRELADDIKKEWEKQHAEYVYDTTKPTIFGGNTYIGGGYRIGGGGGPPRDPTKPADPDADNTFMQDMISIYGSREKVPIVMATKAKAAWEAANSGTMKDQDATDLRQKLLTDANSDIAATRAEEHKQTAESAAQKRFDTQQDNQYATQRRLHKVDDLEGNLKKVIAELSKEIGPPDPETGLFPENPRGNISGAGLGAFNFDATKDRQGKRNSKAVKELLDTKIRKATGAAANIGEEKRFQEIMGWGMFLTDKDLIDGVNQAIEFLQHQNSVIDGYFPDAAERFHARMAEREKAKEKPKEKLPDRPVIQGDKIILPDGRVGPNTPKNRQLLGL